MISKFNNHHHLLIIIIFRIQEILYFMINKKINNKLFVKNRLNLVRFHKIKLKIIHL